MKMFGGGPLPPATGDYLVSQGVHLRAQYGGTEFGIPVACNLDEEHEYWAWQRFSNNVSTRLIPQGDGTFELQCLVITRSLFIGVMLSLTVPFNRTQINIV